MGGCMSSEGARRKVLLLGLEGAGKSSLALALDTVGPPVRPPPTAPSGSVSAVNRVHKGLSFTLWDQGGTAELRPYWRHHYLGTQGVVFVVDATGDKEELDEAAEALRSCMSDPQLDGVPVVVLLTHNDEEGAQATPAVSESMRLDETLGGARTWTVLKGNVANDPPSGLMEMMDWLAQHTAAL